MTLTACTHLELPQLIYSTLAVSHLSFLECRVALSRRGDQVSLDRFEVLFVNPDLLIVKLSTSVVELAAKLRANHRWHIPHALQAAC